MIPSAFAASGVLLMIEWAISPWFPRVAAVLVYLHCGCLGGLLISGFWWGPANSKAFPAG